MAIAASGVRIDKGMRMGISRKGRKRAAVPPRLRSVLGGVNNHGTTLALLFVTVCAFCQEAAAQPAYSDSGTAREVVAGVTHRRIVRAAGPWVLSVLEVDLRRHDLEVRHVRACDRLVGRERPSDIARRLRKEGVEVVGVLNADFFDLRGGTGATESNIIIDGEIVKAVTVTESPFDAFDNVHTQFGLTRAGAPVLDRFELKGVVRTPSGEWPLTAVNANVPGALVLLTSWSDSAVLTTTSADSVAHVTLLKVGGRGDTAYYRVDSTGVKRGPGVVTAEQDAVLMASGSALAVVERLRPRERLEVIMEL